MQDSLKRAEVIFREADEAWKKAGANPTGDRAEARARAETALGDFRNKAQAAAVAEHELLEGKGGGFRLASSPRRSSVRRRAIRASSPGQWPVRNGATPRSQLAVRWRRPSSTISGSATTSRVARDQPPPSARRSSNTSRPSA